MIQNSSFAAFAFLIKKIDLTVDSSQVARLTAQPSD
jgi:hypothetical protein